MSGPTRDRLTLAQLAARTGEPAHRLRQWRARGLIGSRDSEEFGPVDLERARLVQTLLRRGIGLEAIARAAGDGVLDRYIELLFPAGVGPTYSMAEAAEMVGLDLDLLRRVWTAAGFAEQGETLREQDLEGIRLLKAALEAGFPEEALMQAVRVYADALGRVAELEARLFHFYIHEPLRAAGLSGTEVTEALRRASDLAGPLTEPVVLFFHRKGYETALRADIVLDIEEAALPEEADAPGKLRRATVFVDLSSFTPLAEAMGDLRAAQVLARFSELVRQSASRWEGRVVKQIGDAFMLVLPEAASAVACALEIEERAASEPRFPAVRSGIHWGEVLYREGDYVGTSINIAARVAGEAQRHQVLVTGAMRQEAGSLTDVEFVPLGSRRLKGLAQEVELFEARPAASRGGEKRVDPVCGMELGPGEAAATLTLGGREHVFCADECLRRFVAAPERYSS